MPNPAATAREVLQQKRTYISHAATGPFHAHWQQQPLGRLLFTEKGIIHLRVKGRILLVPSWYCAWIPAGLEHEMWSHSRDLFVRNIFFESAFCQNPCFHQPAIFNGSELFRNMIRHTEKWHENREDNIYELTFSTAIRQMMPEEMEQAFRVFLHSSDQPAFQQVLEYIHDNFHESLQISDLAKKWHFSVRSLQRLFEQQAGLSFSSYLKTTRILKAVELLSGSGKNISETAWEVGYNSLPTFSNTFKEVTGLRPEHFLKQ